jgi:hypothetical protein
VSNLAVSWVAVAPSAWRRRLRCVALALAPSSLIASTLVLASGSDLFAGCAGAVAALAGAALAWAWSDRPGTSVWSIGSDGCIAIRRQDEICRGAAVVFASPMFVVLRADRRTLEIWRDVTPVPAFRRLSVAVRWCTARTTSPRLPTINDPMRPSELKAPPAVTVVKERQSLTRGSSDE